MSNSLPLLILEPPYSIVRWLRDDAPDLGSILLLDTVQRPLRATETRTVLDIAPWCPVCVLTVERVGGRGTRRIPRTCNVFGAEPETDLGPAILRAVDDRPRPTPSTLVDWIVSRSRVHNVSRTLSDLFTRPALRRMELAYLPYSVRDQLALLGRWNAIDWQNAAQLADLAADRTSLMRLLGGNDFSSIETRRLMKELLGVSEQEFQNAHGWEWVLELSLRRSGFFDRSPRDFRQLPARRVAQPGAGMPAYANRNVEHQKVSA